MIVWRVSFRESLDGSDVAGRWNEKGIRVLYTSANPSLCSWEYFAHQVSGREWPIGLKLLKIEIPDQHSSIIKISHNKLPLGWNQLTHTKRVRETARLQLISKNLLGMWIPSVIIPEDFNLILNPNYPDYTALVKRNEIIPFEYDERFKFIFP